MAGCLRFFSDKNHQEAKTSVRLKTTIRIVQIYTVWIRYNYFINTVRTFYSK